MQSRIIFLVGPTAVGKTEVAIKLAKKINAEIISCDSMQIYKGMDIITAKPNSKLTKKVPYHLISIISPTKEYNVFRYRKAAIKKIKEIIKKGKTPLFVGGSGLYVSTLIDGIFKDGSEDKSLREKLYQQAEKFGSQFLYNKLKKVDLEAASRIHPHDLRRIVRALEVFKTTGKPISILQKQRRGLTGDYEVIIFGLNMLKDRLYERIRKRTEKMFKQGLVEEAEKLLKLKLSKTASFAIGLTELKGYFLGLYDLEEAKRLIQRNTYLYARRQLTWFKKDKRINWINLNGKETTKDIVQRIWRKLY